MATIIYKLSNKLQADGRSQIIIWLRANRKLQMQMQSNIFVLPKFFAVTGENGGAKIGYIKPPKQSKLNFAEAKEATEAKTRLQDLTNKILKLCEITPTEELTKDYIKSNMQILGSFSVQDLNATSLKQYKIARAEAEAKAERLNIFEYADIYIQEKKPTQIRSRYFKVMMRCLHRWQDYRRANFPKEHFTIEIDTLTKQDLQDFREYITNEHELQKEQPKLFEKLLNDYPIEIGTKHKKKDAPERGENTIIKLFRYLKAFWNWLLIQKEATKNNPFIGFEIGTAKYGTPFHLTIEERNKLAEFDLSNRPALAIQRDIFVFQCLVGCRVSDLYKFTEANITKGILEYVPNKTKDNVQQVKPRVPLNDRAKAIIERYKGKDLKGRLFPYIAQQNYNEAIKEMLKLCGIDRNVSVRNSLTGETEIKPIYEVASSHMARRTFIGCAYSKVQDPNLIGKMSGHVEGSRAFARYRAIDDDLLKNVISLID